MVQFHADLWHSHWGVDGQGLSNPAAVGVNHHQAQRLHTEQRDLTCVQIKTRKQMKEEERHYHDHFDSLCYRVGFVVLLFLHHSGKVAQLPDRMALLTLTGQLQKQTQHSQTI